MKKYSAFFASLICAFQLFAQPAIHSFAPTTGPVGTTVMIVGTGFGTTPSTNVVYFGAVKGVVATASDTILTVTVPTGATSQPLSVTTNHQTGYAALSFIVTFDGAADAFMSNSFLQKTALVTGVYPHGLSIADFNSDGKPDLLVSKGSSNTISVFTNITANNTLSFAAKTEIAAAGNSHESCATGDLDGDGKLDVVVVNSFNSPSVSVFRNNSSSATIAFDPRVDYPADAGPYSVAIGNLDSDGKPDLVVANNGSNVISVYRNTSTPGTISFESKIDFTVGTNPYSVAIGDLDSDGKADLAVTTQSTSSSLYVLKNITASGVLSFDTPIAAAGLSGSFVVSITDMDGDGKPDLAATGAGTNSVVVVHNTSTPGNLFFNGQQDFSTGTYPVCVAFGDLDGDGLPDLVTSNWNSDNISALKNTSSIGNISFAAPVPYAVGAKPIYVAVGDLDGDSRPDIAVANSSDTTVSILKNMIGTNLAPAIQSFTPTSGVNGTRITIHGSNFSSTTAVTFGGVPAASFTVDSASGITAVIGAGATGDVKVTTAYGTASRSGFQFNGPVITSFTPTIGVAGTIVTINGLNFTGVTDVRFGGTSAASFAITSPTTITATLGTGSSGNVTVTTANGTATLPGFSFGAPTITSVLPSSAPVGTDVTITGTNFSSVAADNLAFFGAVKATVTSATVSKLHVTVPAGATYQPLTVTTNHLTAYSAQPFSVTFPSDSIALSVNAFSAAANYGTGTYPSAVMMCDLNDDGKTDLLTANSVGNTLSVLQNNSSNGTLLFRPRIDFATGTNPKQIATGDLDGDGKPDVAVTNFNSGNASTVSIFRNTTTSGTLAFAPKQDIVTGNGTNGIAMGDLDGDGKPDIAIASGNSGFISVLKNTTTMPGAITFAPKQDYTLFSHPDALALADLDGDNRPDIVTSNFSDRSVSIFRNTSTSGFLSFDGPINFAVGNNPTYVTTGDLDGDGKLDLIVTNYSSSLSFLKNYSGNGSISFAPKQDYTMQATNVSVCDVDGDGRLDLVAGRGLSGVASLLQNAYTGTGTFSFAHALDFSTGNYDTYVAAGDLNGDGKPELVVANTISNTVSVMTNKINEPVIASLSVATGNSGTSITLNGTHFTGASAVTFGGTPAKTFTVASPTKITAVVGGGASGTIAVTTPSGTATVAGFKFIPDIHTQDTTFCNGDTATLISTAIANNQWYKNGNPINGATAQSLKVISSGTYTVKTTSNGITTASTGLAINVKTVATPAITKDANNSLVSSSVAGNQWYQDGVLISGATGQLFHPTQNGVYSVKDTLDGCVSDFSASVNYVLTAIVDVNDTEYIRAFPNPVKKNLYIRWSNNRFQSLNADLTDTQGKAVLSTKNIHTGASVDVSALPEGIYLLRLYNKQHSLNRTFKIVRKN